MPGKINYKKNPVVPLVPVGTNEYGILEVCKIYDLTAPEHDYRKSLFEEHGIKDEFEALLDIGDQIAQAEQELKAKDDKTEKEHSELTFSEVKSLLSVIETVPNEETAETQLAQIRQDYGNLKAKILEIKEPKKYYLTEYDAINGLMNNDTTLSSRYLREVQEMTKEKEESETLRLRILATLILKYRFFTPSNQQRLKDLHDKEQDKLVTENKIADHEKTEYEMVTDWELEDTINEINAGNLHYKMIVCLAEFADQEMNHWEKQDPNSPLSQEELKKRLEKLERDSNSKKKKR